MAVTFNVVLCDDAADAFDGHYGLEISAQDTVQTEEVINSSQARTIGRGNSRYTVRFNSKKRHASVAAAVAYCASQTVATRGTASFSGFGLSLDNAVCTISIRHVGVTTEATYTITGSKTPADIV